MEGQPPKKDGIYGIWVLGIYFMNHPMNPANSFKALSDAFRLHPSSSNNLKSSRWRVRWDDLGFFSWLWATKKGAPFGCLVDKQWMNYYPVMWRDYLRSHEIRMPINLIPFLGSIWIRIFGLYWSIIPMTDLWDWCILMPARMIDFYANVKCREIYKLGGGFKCVFFSPLPGEMIQFDSYFSDGLVQPPPSKRLPPYFFIVFCILRC